LALAITVVFILALFAYLGISAVSGKRKARARDSARKSTPLAGTQDSGPGFNIETGYPGKGQDPGFIILGQTNGHPSPGRPGMQQPRQAPRREPRAGTDGFRYVISDNPTAICKLTGRRVRDCTCDKHKGKK
jgi:hypothetical protein